MILCVGMLYLAYSCARLKRVFFDGDQLHVSSVWRSVDISLKDVLEAVWIQEPQADYTPEAALLLRKACIFGSEIRFTPRSAQIFESFRQALAAHQAQENRV